ncbi:radical SAM protein [bacterium]|nr:radical SAM protein [bacterium]
MRFSQYNINIDTDYGLLLYNTNSKEVVKMKNESLVKEYKDLLNSDNLSFDNKLVQVLYDKKFIVDDNVDEFEQAKKYQYELLDREDNKAHILIHTTDNCNFRCTYCFKEARPKNLSDENWNNLYLYLKNNIESKNINQVCLVFYGGEPLLRYEKIVEFMKRVNSLKETFSDLKIFYRMITNGYLLTKEVYDNLALLGMNQYQITLDGFADSHNKMRPLVNGNGTWNRIVENLRYINTQDDDISIQLRTNFNQINKDEMEGFNKWLELEFTNKKFVFFKASICKFSEIVDDNLILDSNDDFVKSQLLENLKLKHYLGLSNHGMICRYSRKYMFALSTSGKISHCEETDNEDTIIGELTSGGIIKYHIPYEEWRSRLEVDKCKTCVLYPLCLARACSKSLVCDSLFDNFEVIKKYISENNIFD